MTIFDYSHWNTDVSDKPTYTTEQAAKRIGISKSTLLRWIKARRVDDVRRDRNGWRVFRGEDVEKIKKKAS